MQHDKNIQAKLSKQQFVKHSALKNTLDCNWSELVVHALDNLYDQVIGHGALPGTTTTKKEIQDV